MRRVAASALIVVGLVLLMSAEGTPAGLAGLSLFALGLGLEFDA